MSDSHTGSHEQQLHTASQGAAKKQWRTAVSLLRPLTETGHLEASRLLCQVLLSAGRPAEAAEHLAVVIDAHPGDVQLLKQLGDCHLQASRWQPALTAYQHALALLQDQQQQHRQQATLQVHAKDDPTSQPQQLQDAARPAHVLDLVLQSCCAAAMYPQGGAHAEAAVHLVQSVMQQQAGKKLPQALKLYSQVALDRQLWAAAATAAVELLAQQPEDREVQKLLAHAVQDSRGMDGLLSAVLSHKQPMRAAQTCQPGSAPAAADTAEPAPAANSQAASTASTSPVSAAAMAFLANVLLTQGAVQQAVRLYRCAVQLCPGSSRCVLGLAQALEVHCDYDGVLQAFLGLCRSNSQQQLGPLKLQEVLALSALQQAPQRPLAFGSLDWIQHTTAQQHTAAHEQHTAGRQAIAKSSTRQQDHHQQQQHEHQQQQEHPQRQEHSRQRDAGAEQGAGQDHSPLTKLMQTALHIDEAVPQQTGKSTCMPHMAGWQLAEACDGSCLPLPTASQLSADPPAQMLPQMPQQQQPCRQATMPPGGLHEQQQHCEEACVLYSSASTPAHHSCPAAAAAASRAAEQLPVPALMPTAVDLSKLALVSTAAKVLFCGGALQAAQQLLQWCEVAEQAAAAQQPLHHSSVRNEVAYAKLLRTLLLEVPPPLCARDLSHRGSYPVLYVCGDSHVLPLAWRTLLLHGQQHLMVPLLITGCKAWHLRPGSMHPCAQQLKSALATVPSNGKVLLVVGEIDCREGLLMSVEKMQYESLQAAVAATVEAYVGAILQLLQEHSLQVFVHSVPPVLPETRHVVHLFNIALRQQLQAAMQAQPELNGMLKFVDLEDVLLQHGECLRLDGSHLHPSYSRYLQDALSCKE